VNRFFVQASVYGEFTQRLTDAVRKLRVGNALEQEVDQGPLISEAAFGKVVDHVKDALSKGATVLTGGNAHALGGTFYEPTVLAHANRSMSIAQEETFGPVAACFRFETEAEAITLANDTPFGLAAYFYTRDLGRAWRVADALETGMVGINEGIISTEVAPFGGVKQSGLGREGSKYGLDEYTELKYMMISGLGIER
jgi:succinate-semialdehyde dehydrogenase/glutarate-semialdehyde dehydrogenase